MKTEVNNNDSIEGLHDDGGQTHTRTFDVIDFIVSTFICLLNIVEWLLIFVDFYRAACNADAV